MQPNPHSPATTETTYPKQKPKEPLTPIRLAEQLTKPGDIILILAPTMTLMSKYIREWNETPSAPITSHVICEDPSIIGIYNTTAPTYIDAQSLFNNIRQSSSSEKRTIIFSTYQTIKIITTAQKLTLEIALLICHESILNESPNKDSINAKRRLHII